MIYDTKKKKKKFIYNIIHILTTMIPYITMIRLFYYYYFKD